MQTKQSLQAQLKKMGIPYDGTLLVHSSMKSIGEVKGGADTVLDALSEYMKAGLLVLPTHTWSYIKADNPKFDVQNSPSCVGVLTELFRKRAGVIRSLHPTHSVAALGKDAEAFTSGDEQFDTPCARGSAWGKLLDRKAKIVMVGVDLKRCTYIHGIEEWVDIQGRLTDDRENLYTVLPDRSEIHVPSRRHCGLSWSLHFWKVERVLRNTGAIFYGKFGNANAIVCDAVRMYEVLSVMLSINREMFSDNEPLEPYFEQQMMARFSMEKGLPIE